MQPFTTLDAVAAPLDLVNIDTDQIIPARFLWKQRKEGYGELLFHDARLDAAKLPRADFVLNRSEYREARILVAGRNFGCGSSREQAVWALYDAGFRSVIAPSFGDIFYNNSFQNGLLPVVLPQDRVAVLIALLQARAGAHVTIDLPTQTVTGPDGIVDEFEVGAFRKECLLAGHDDIGFTLGHSARIAAFENNYERQFSWS